MKGSDGKVMGHKAEPDSSANRDLYWQDTVVYKIK